MTCRMITLWLFVFAAASAVQGQPNDQKLRLWYDKPATEWESEALPIGNGRIGGMVFGGVPTERVALNEDTLWSGEPKDWDNPDAIHWLPKVRRAIFDGDFELATELCRNMQGPYNQSYQPLGDLWIDYLHGDAVADYRRELDLMEGVASVRYRIGDDCYQRTAFVTHPDQGLVLRLECSRPGGLEFDIRLDSQLRHTTNAPEDHELILTGQCPSHVDPNYLRDSENPIIYDDGPNGKGMTFAACLRVISDGRKVARDRNRLKIRGASAATVVLTAATSFNGPHRSPSREGEDPLPLALAHMEKAASKPYSLLKETHQKDFRALMQRVSLDLGSDVEVIGLPTDQRLVRHGQGEPDNHLEMLMFQYGRYLTVSSSRPGSQPINLQGIWNDKMRPPWSDNWTMNINVQMSYWPVEVSNLSECHEPLFRFLEECVKPGSRTARIFYGCDGWLTHHNVDLWRQTAPVGNHGHGKPRWANWPMGGAWTCQHLMEHYRFTGDKQFLRKQAYPLMKGAAEFCLDWLIEDGKGNLVTAPATSPENVFLWPERNTLCAVSMASTMDMSLIWNLFSDCIDAAEALKTDEDFREKLLAARERLYPLKIGRHGQLQEWFLDWDRPEDHHRHMSHLVGFYPGNRILYHTHPELTKAVRTSLLMRESGQNVGWSAGWKICLGARLHDSQFCHEMIRQKFRRNVFPNLLGCCPPMIMDSNFGYTAGVAEMLMQSHENAIELLPALPAAWPDGEFRGLRARGGFEVSLAWVEGHLQWAEIRSLLGKPLRIRYGDQVRRIDDLHEGETHRMSGEQLAGVHGEEITRRVTQLWGLQRTGSRIRKAVERALKVVTAGSAVSRDGDFYSLCDPGEVFVRDRGEVESATLRKPEMIPPAEIRKAVLAIVQVHLGVAEDEAIVEAARLFSFKSTSPRLRQVVQGEIMSMLRNHTLDQRNGKLYVSHNITR